jgi:hypothetical protein
MKLMRVESRVVEAIGYDEEQRVLQVIFAGGRAYNYLDVPYSVFDDLMQAESVGNFIMKYIVDKYPEEELG